jgi:TPP-dependent pyruvate/acetoin dehydrogenase alpha subunit
VSEAFNLAKLWNLPVVFICENNHYGMGTSQVRLVFASIYHGSELIDVSFRIQSLTSTGTGITVAFF